MKLPQLTIVLITHRKDERFLQALTSAQFAQEVLIFDHQSGNDWQKLKQQFHFTVKKVSDFRSFSTLRNEAKKLITTQWTLYLDSDEYISALLQEEIKYAIQDPTTIAYRLHRVDVFAEKLVQHGEVGSSYPLRLIQTRYIQWKGKAHEELRISTKLKQSTLQIPLLHLSHENLSEFLSKINYYTSLLSEERKESSLIIKMLMYPVGKFIWTFLFKAGFRDGMRGLVYSFMMSVHSLTVRVKRYENQHL